MYLLARRWKNFKPRPQNRVLILLVHFPGIYSWEICEGFSEILETFTLFQTKI